MSKKYGFGVKLAVAALAVAGVVGVAVADDVCEDLGCTAEMSVGFDIAVADTAKIEAINVKTLTKDELWANGLTVTGDNQDKVGTLGIIRVTTTADKWDVELTTKWGGKLVHVGEETGNGIFSCPPGYTQNPWNTDMCRQTGVPDVPKVEGKNPGSTKSLVHVDKSLSTGSAKGVINASGASSYDTVQLLVRIGICDLGADLDGSAGANTYYNLGAPSAYSTYLPVEISSSDLQGTRSYDHNGTPATAVPVSFALKFGTAYGSDDLPDRNLIWSDIVTPAKQFNTPRLETPSGLIKHQQHFYINVGMNGKTVGVPILEKKETNGQYSETFTFTLTHNLTI